VLRMMAGKRPSPDTPLGARDHAMLLVCFGAALRRSELVALTTGDLRILMQRSKTDQQGQEIAVWANPSAAGFCPLMPSPAGWSAGAPHRIWIWTPVSHPAPSARCSAR
jgi:hypothetical protein